MIVTDPILSIERRLGDELVRVHDEVLGFGETHVHVPLRNPPLVYLVDRMPELEEDAKRVARREVIRVTEQLLGRVVEGPITSNRPAPGSVVVLLRLGAPKAPAAPTT